MSSVEQVVSVLKRADAVCFDVDSTVCQGEGIDELARFCGKGSQVKEMTLLAMSGAVEFRDALQLRLDIIQPTKDQIDLFNLKHPVRLTRKIDLLINTLKDVGVATYLVSGGFDCLIHPVAKQLGIPMENVFANGLEFHQDGSYMGFDESRLTSKSGGKGCVVAMLKEQNRYSTVIMIGDGVTDLEACPPADAFIGFGGNIVRKEVASRAAWFVTDFQDIIDVFKH